MISVIIPTTEDRKDFNDRVAKMVENQDYPNIEMIFCYGADTVGSKRNSCCERANGQIICHFDSDDYYASNYISTSFHHLINSKADVTGLSSAYFLHQNLKEAWLYRYNASAPYVIGSGMMYHKQVWARNKFEPINNGEDTVFLANAGYVSPHGYINGFIATIHSNNTSSHQAVHKMIPISPEIPLNILSKM